MLILDYRASKILYNYLESNKFPGIFLIPANTCPILPLVFLKSQTKFEFVDISSEDYCIDKNLVIQKIKANSKKYSGILYIRSYGVDCSVESFFKQIKSYNENFIIVDDCCLCKPDTHYTESDFVDLKLFSTGYAKYVDIGEGAFAFLRENVKLKYNQLCKFFNDDDYQKLMNGIKESIRKDEIIYYDANSLWLTNKLISDDYLDRVQKKLVETILHKNALNSIYNTNLPDEIKMGYQFQNWRFNIVVKPEVKKMILTSLFENRLFASDHYNSLSHIFGQKRTPVAEKIKMHVINLFNDNYYSEEQAVKTCVIINMYI